MMIILTVSVISIGLLVCGLWAFSRLAWGGGIRTPSYSLLKPHTETTTKQRGAGLPIPDRTSFELRCLGCAYVRPLPEIAQLPGLLVNIQSQIADPTEIQKPCPECGGRLQSWLHREITHRSGDHDWTFATMRRGQKMLYAVDGHVYASLSAIPAPGRALVAAATNATEEV